MDALDAPLLELNLWHGGVIREMPLLPGHGDQQGAKTTQRESIISTDT